MNTFRNPLSINVGFLLNQPNGTYRDLPFQLPGLELSPDTTTGQIEGTTRISRTSEGLLVQGDFQTHITAACVRCLEDTEQELHTEFTELFYFPRFEGFEQPDEGDEPELVLPENGYIDLEPLLREYLLLEIPIKALCRPDCKGLCPYCGVNLNETTCEHVQQHAKSEAVYQADSSGS